MKYLATIFLLGLLTVTSSTQSSKPQTASKKDKPAASTAKTVRTPSKKPDETAEWDKAMATTDVTPRIAALRKFVETFPKSKKKADAAGLIVAMAAELGNQKLQAGDMPAAAELFKTAAKNSPKPLLSNPHFPPKNYMVTSTSCTPNFKPKSQIV